MDISNNDQHLKLHIRNDIGNLTITVLQPEIWIAYIDECYEMERLRLTYNEVWTGLEDQLIGLYSSESEMEKGIQIFYMQTDHFCD